MWIQGFNVDTEAQVAPGRSGWEELIQEPAKPASSRLQEVRTVPCVLYSANSVRAPVWCLVLAFQCSMFTIEGRQLGSYNTEYIDDDSVHWNPDHLQLQTDSYGASASLANSPEPKSWHQAMSHMLVMTNFQCSPFHARPQWDFLFIARHQAGPDVEFDQRPSRQPPQLQSPVPPTPETISPNSSVFPCGRVFG